MRKVIALALARIVLISQTSLGVAEFRSTGEKESCYMRINACCDEPKTFVDGANWSLKNALRFRRRSTVFQFVPRAACR